MSLFDPTIANNYEQLQRLPESRVPVEIRQRINVLRAGVATMDMAVPDMPAIIEQPELQRTAPVSNVLRNEVMQPVEPAPVADVVAAPAVDMTNMEDVANEARRLLATLDMPSVGDPSSIAAVTPERTLAGV